MSLMQKGVHSMPIWINFLVWILILGVNGDIVLNNWAYIKTDQSTLTSDRLIIANFC